MFSMLSTIEDVCAERFPSQDPKVCNMKQLFQATLIDIGVPILGNIFDMPKDSQLIPVFNKWYREYGDVVSFSILGVNQVILNTEKAANDLFVQRGNNYSDRGAPTAVAIGISKGRVTALIDRSSKTGVLTLTTTFANEPSQIPGVNIGNYCTMFSRVPPRHDTNPSLSWRLHIPSTISSQARKISRTTWSAMLMASSSVSDWAA